MSVKIEYDVIEAMPFGYLVKETGFESSFHMELETAREGREI